MLHCLKEILSKLVDLQIRELKNQNALFPIDIQDYLQVLNINTPYLTVTAYKKVFLKIYLY